MRVPIRFGCDITPDQTLGDVHRALDYAKMVEDYGFDTVMSSDHLFHPFPEFLGRPPPDVFTLLAAMTVKTKRIRLMPAVTDPIRRHPVVVAQAIATLDHLSNGRIMLGYGAGEAFNINPLRDLEWSEPYSRLEEAIMLLKQLWKATGPVTFEGRFFKVRDAEAYFKPLQEPHPPIYIGGYGPKIRRLIGRVADGWIPWTYTPGHYERDLRLIREAAEKAGRTLDDIDTALIVPMVLGKDSEKAWEILSVGVKMTMVVRTQLLKDLGLKADELLDMRNTIFRKDDAEKLKIAAERVPSELVREVAVGGTAEEAIERIDRFVHAGVRHFVMLPYANFEESIKIFGEKVIPHFK